MDAYLPERVDVETRAGTVEAITFITNIDGPLHADGLSEQAIAEVVATASGSFGSCLDYLVQTLASIEALGLRDRDLGRVKGLAKPFRHPSSE